MDKRINYVVDKKLVSVADYKETCKLVKEQIGMWSAQKYIEALCDQMNDYTFYGEVVSISATCWSNNTYSDGLEIDAYLYILVRTYDAYYEISTVCTPCNLEFRADITKITKFGRQ